MKDISLLIGNVERLGNRPHAKKPNGQPPTKTELYDFAHDTGNDAFVLDFWELNAPRGWCDRYGKRIMNWRGCFLNYCKAIREKERQEESRGANGK